MLSQEEIEEIKAYNERIDKIRKIIYKTLVSISLICFGIGIFHPVYDVCLVFLIIGGVLIYFSNMFCDD